MNRIKGKKHYCSWIRVSLILLVALMPFQSNAETTDQVLLPNMLASTLDSADTTFLSPYEKEALYTFYRERHFSPAWVNRFGLTGPAANILDIIEHAYEDGLNPNYYRVASIRTLLEAKDNTSKVLADITLSFAILRYSNDMLHGRYNPGRSEKDISPEFLTGIAKATPGEFPRLFASLAPSLPQYMDLKKALVTYRAIEARGGWPRISPYILLQQNNKTPEVLKLRKILTIMGDMVGSVDDDSSNNIDNGNDIYDETVVEAVKRFQIRHGLEPDGIVGRFTRDEINTPASQRVRQIMVTMERMRWLARPVTSRYAIVNIPAYQLTAVENGKVFTTMKVIVGRPLRQTPTMSRAVSHVIFNPPWGVPARIATEDLLPKIKKNPNLFDLSGFQLFKYSNGQAVEVDPNRINWNNMDPESFKQYTLRQIPSNINPLGKVKFQIPDSSSVYLHDTPEKELFSQFDRDYSSGCIRLEHPETFANFVLDGQKPWNPDAVANAFNTSKSTKYIKVNAPLMVHVVYWSTWVDSEGKVYFGFDVYKKDMALASLMFSSLFPEGSIETVMH